MPPRKVLPVAGRDAMLAQVDSIPLRSIDDLQSIGDVFVKSGLFADARDAAKAMVKIVAGRELGLPPFASMTGINIIQGKPTLSAALMGTVIQRSGTHRYVVTKMEDEAVSIAFSEKLDGVWTSCGPDSTFTMKDAIKAGLFTTANYKKYPRNMLYARALSNGAKWYCAGVFGGPVYVPEELGAIVDEEERVVAIPTEATIGSRAVTSRSPEERQQIIDDRDSGDSLHDAVSDIVAILDKDYRSWRKNGIWTKRFFGVEMTDEATLLAFAKQAQVKWRNGVALIWEQQG